MKHYLTNGCQFGEAEQTVFTRMALVRPAAALLFVTLLGPAGAGAGERLAIRPDIPVYLDVVACASDLLHCRDIEARQAVFGDMADCLAELPGAKREAVRVSRPAAAVIFARCRYSPAAARLVRSETVEPNLAFGITQSKVVAKLVAGLWPAIRKAPYAPGRQ